MIAGDLDAPGVEAMAADVSSASGRKVIGVALDVSDTATVVAAADRAIHEFGRLDIWVNNAGISYATGPAVDVTDEFIDRMFAVNTRGTFVGAREAARRMPNGGVIINLASTTGFRASVGISAYVASKHAVVGATKALALEFGPFGIRVLGIAPTVMDTPGVRIEMEPLMKAGLDVSKRAATNPLRRIGVADDMARVVVFAPATSPRS